MCVAAAAPLLGMGIGSGVLEQMGDPLGTKKAREDKEAESQQNKWAREDAIRDATFAHEREMAGIQYGRGGNRPQLGVSRGTGTGTPTSTRGGGRSQSGAANRAS